MFDKALIRLYILLVILKKFFHVADRGLSLAGIIALSISACILVVLVGALVIGWVKIRRSRIQVKQKPFDNAVKNTELWRSSHKNWHRSCWKQYYLGNEDTSDNLLVYCKFWVYTKDSKNLISPGKKRGVVRFWSIFFNFLPCNIWKALLKDNKTEMVQHSLSWTLIFIAELK